MSSKIWNLQTWNALNAFVSGIYNIKLYYIKAETGSRRHFYKFYDLIWLPVHCSVWPDIRPDTRLFSVSGRIPDTAYPPSQFRYPTG
jgi:hypothetical protein